MYKDPGFTLAEVLITLGIIGIVAAMTMPVLIQNHRNKVVETRLEKFYSAINQAVLLSEADNGDKQYWFADLQGADIDDEGNPIEGSSNLEKWFKKYIMPYLNDIKYETLTDGTFIIYFADGSALATVTATNGRDWYFYPSNVEKCMEKTVDKANGVCRFVFSFKPVGDEYSWKYHINKGFEPTKYRWDGSVDTLYRGCRNNIDDSAIHSHCSALIQYYGWKIPKDYPFRISY